MNNILYIAGFIKASVLDGPGLRSVLFLQGCNRRCYGCHNFLIWDKNKENVISIEKILKYINVNCLVKKITISGGEPLEQREALEKLLKGLRSLDFDICLYTGYNLNDVHKEIIGLLNYLKVGPYYSNMKSDKKAFVGSSNQVFYKVNKDIGGKLCLTEI